MPHPKASSNCTICLNLISSPGFCGWPPPCERSWCKCWCSHKANLGSRPSDGQFESRASLASRTLGVIVCLFPSFRNLQLEAPGVDLSAGASGWPLPLPQFLTCNTGTLYINRWDNGAHAMKLHDVAFLKDVFAIHGGMELHPCCTRNRALSTTRTTKDHLRNKTTTRKLLHMPLNFCRACFLTKELARGSKYVVKEVFCICCAVRQQLQCQLWHTVSFDPDCNVFAKDGTCNRPPRVMARDAHNQRT